MIRSDILILGAGLTGLTLHYLLKDRPVKTVLVEARERLGGRINTVEDEGTPPIEMGATWLGEKHIRLNALLQELELPLFPQYLGNRAIYEWISTSPHQLVDLPPNDEPSYRIRGGTTTLIRKLAGFLEPAQLYLGHVASTMELKGGRVRVTTNREVFDAGIVVSTLPPFLLHTRVHIQPILPSGLRRVMAQTHTWMGESIKFGLGYDRPFWRAPGTSGTVFSNVGPISEMYDHSGFEEDSFALKGFFNPAYHSLTREERLQMILGQLRKYYGPAVDGHTTYQEALWAHEAFTFSPYQAPVFPHQNNGDVAFRKPCLDEKLFIAGSETAEEFPGYMEGAVRSAEFVYGQLRDLI